MAPSDPDDLAVIVDLRAEVARLMADAETTRAETGAEIKYLRDANDREFTLLQGAHTAEMAAMHDALDSQEAKFESAIAARILVEQARGVLMSTLRCTADEASELMRIQSQLQNLNLNDIAAQILAHTVKRTKPRPG